MKHYSLFSLAITLSTIALIGSAEARERVITRHVQSNQVALQNYSLGNPVNDTFVNIDNPAPKYHEIIQNDTYFMVDEGLLPWDYQIIQNDTYFGIDQQFPQ